MPSEIILLMRTQPGYSSWDCSPAILPPRSRLYPLTPIGIGTPFVESLSGYVARLADAHAVSVGNLVVRELVALAVGSPLFQSADPDRFYPRFNAVNSLGEPAGKWVRALQAGTMREDLHFLTLLPFKDLLWGLAIFRRRRAWCPACYEDDHSAGRPVYERLQWALQTVGVCSQHQCRLEEVCPRCSQSSKPFTVNSRPGHCFKCQTWLGASDSEFDRLAQVNYSDEELWNANEVGLLLGAAPGLDSTTLRRTFAANFQACADCVAGGRKGAFASAAHVLRDTLRAMMKCDSRPSLSTLLRVSHHLGIQLTTFLERDLVGTPSSWTAAQARIRAGQRPSRPSPEYIKAALKEAVSELPPPRLCDVAGRLGYIKPTRLYRVEGALCRQINSNYQNAIRPVELPSSKQFCPSAQVKAALEESLTQEIPTPTEHIAMRLGFAGASSLSRKFPDLCRAIQDKIDKHKAFQLAAMERTLTAALGEDPPPSLEQLCERLGCCRSAVLRGHFSALCDQLMENRRANRVRQVQKLRQQLHEFSIGVPAVSLEQVCKRVGLSRQQLIRLCPEECAAIVAHFEKSSRESQQRRVEEANRQIRQIVTSLHQEGKLPSFKRVHARLGKSAAQDWKATAEVIRTARAELENRSGESRNVP